MDIEDDSQNILQKFNYLYVEVYFVGNVFLLGRCIISKAEEDVVS